MFPLPPVRYRNDRYELQPAAGGGKKYCLLSTIFASYINIPLQGYQQCQVPGQDVWHHQGQRG